MFFSIGHTREGVAIIGHALHFSFDEIMEFEVEEYANFLEIAGEILRTKSV